MNRLTFRTEDGWVGVNNLEDKTVSPTSVAIHKLAEFEDFMEEQGFEDLETFKMAIKLMQSMNSVGVKYCAENQKLKDKWQKILSLIKEIEDKPFKNLKPLYVRGYKDCIKKIKKEMQELEGSNINVGGKE